MTGFPWVSHFTLAEADALEALRQQFPDHAIISRSRKTASLPMPGRSVSEVMGYFSRNRRRTQTPEVA